MDYSRYSNLGVGSVPPLLSGAAIGGAGLVDPTAAAVAAAAGSGPPPPIPGAPSSLLPPPHQPHPSLLFHYGVGGKPPLPPHLLPSSVSGTMPPSISSTGSSNIVNSCSSSNAGLSSLMNSKPSGSGLGRTTSAVPPLSLTSSLPLTTTTAISSRPGSPGSSSFAAALRSLAKQATGPPGAPDGEGSHGEIAVQCSPKTNASLTTTSNGPSVVVPSAPPVVTIAPTHSHPSLQDLRKPENPSVLPELERNGPEDIVRGFQPYRAPDLPAVSAATASQSPLRPTLPMELAHAYSPYPSIYPHPLSHQYRLEEQLYLEQRFGLLRPPIAPPYSIGSLSSLYPTSPYLSARFPPEILPTSLAALHPSSALLHERLKLEEDMRHREYELELRRERELEKERERERERERGREREREKEKEREREKEKERRHKEQELERNKEDKKSSEVFRDRSPLGHPSGLWNATSASSSSSMATNLSKSGLNSATPYLKKGQSIGIPSQQPTRPIDSRPSKQMNEWSMSSGHHHSTGHSSKSSRDAHLNKYDHQSASRNSGPPKQRTPAIVRPFESSPSTSISSPSACVSSVNSLNVIDISPEIKECEPKLTSDKKPAVLSTESSDVTEINRTFNVWQPVRLNAPHIDSSLVGSRKSSTDQQGEGNAAPLSLPPQEFSSLQVKSNNFSSTSHPLVQLSPTPVSGNVLEPPNSTVPNQFGSYGTFLPQPIPLTQGSQNSHSLQTLTTCHSSVTPLLCTSVNSTSKQPTLTNSSNPLTLPNHVHNSVITTIHSANTSISNQNYSSHDSIHQIYPLHISQIPNNLSKNSNFLLPSNQVHAGALKPTVSTNSSTLVTNHNLPVTSATTTTQATSDVPMVTEPVTVSISDSPSSAPPSPEKMISPVSRLDIEEQRLRELRSLGMLAAEAEETLLEESASPFTTSLCTKGPPALLEASNEKLEFLCIFGLTTHSKAEEIELDCCERRAKFFDPLNRLSPVPSSLCDEIDSSKELTSMLAPGNSLTELPKMKGTTSLLSDFYNKSKFLNNLGLQPQYSVIKEKDIESVWNLVLKERIRRYNIDSEDTIYQALGKSLEDLIAKNTKINSKSSSPLVFSDKSKQSADMCAICYAPTLTSSRITNSGLNTDGLSIPLTKVMTSFAPIQGKFNSALTNRPFYESFPTSTAAVTTTTSSVKVQPTLLKVGMKGLLEDGLMSIGNLFSHEHDPLLASLSGIDTMIDHLMKSVHADSGNDNSALLEHIEEVRKSQIAVCQTAHLVQEHVAKLIASKAQLETHRTALHHHLAAITSILAVSNNHKTLFNPPSTSVTKVPDTVATNAVQSTTVNSSPLQTVKPQTTTPVTSMQACHPHPSITQVSLTSTTVTTTFSSLPSKLTTSSILTPDVCPVTTSDSRLSHSILPNSTSSMSWCNLASPFHLSSNVPLSFDTKEGIFQPHLTRDLKDQKYQPSNSTSIPSTVRSTPKIPVTSTINQVKPPVRQVISKPSKPMPSISTTGIPPVGKFNGTTNTQSHITPQALYRPIQLSSTSMASLSSTAKTVASTKVVGGSLSFPCTLAGMELGHSQIPQMAFVTTTLTTASNIISNTFHHSKGPGGGSGGGGSMYLHSNSPSKASKVSKSPVGFVPYTKASPTKVHTWLPH